MNEVTTDARELAKQLLAWTSPSAPFDMRRVRDGEAEVTSLGYPVDDGLWLFAAIASVAGDSLAERYADLLDEGDRERLDSFLATVQS